MNFQESKIMFRYILQLALFIAVLTPVVKGAGADTIVSNAGVNDGEFEYTLPVIQISGFSDQVVFVETFGKDGAAPVTGWQHKGAGQLTLDAQTAIEGNALKIQTQGHDFQIVSQPIALAANKPYKLAFYLKMDPGLTSQVFISTPNQLLPCDTYKAETETGWYYYETFFRTAGVNSVSINLKVSTGKGTLWLDQIALYETEKIASVPLPTGPSFRQTHFELQSMNLTLN